MNLDEMKAKRNEYDTKLTAAVAELERLRQVALRLQGARAALDELIAAEEAGEA
jgi:predicted  nucleic acid-binding Zn-ribbon protein